MSREVINSDRVEGDVFRLLADPPAMLDPYDPRVISAAIDYADYRKDEDKRLRHDYPKIDFHGLLPHHKGPCHEPKTCSDLGLLATPEATKMGPENDAT
ncbi:MAG: hypothetical protein V3V30_04740 [Parvularculaceae bacterium]